MKGAIFIRTVPNVMEVFGCSADTAQRYVDLRDEGYSLEQAKLMAGLSDPPEPRTDGALPSEDYRQGWMDGANEAAHLLVTDDDGVKACRPVAWITPAELDALPRTGSAMVFRERQPGDADTDLMLPLCRCTCGVTLVDGQTKPLSGTDEKVKEDLP